jgi:hypothetical protein
MGMGVPLAFGTSRISLPQNCGPRLQAGPSGPAHRRTAGIFQEAVMSGCDQWHRSGFFVVRFVGNVVLRAEHQCPALFDTAQPQGNECRQISKLVLDGP